MYKIINSFEMSRSPGTQVLSILVLLSMNCRKLAPVKCMFNSEFLLTHGGAFPRTNEQCLWHLELRGKVNPHFRRGGDHVDGSGKEGSQLHL
jgi:hypothetical protein